MSCSCTHESKIRKPSSCGDGARAHRRPRVGGEAVVVERAELGDARRRWWRRTRPARRRPPRPAATRPTARWSDRRRSSRAGRSSGTSSAGSGSPRMKRSSAVMCTRLSCTRPARALGRRLPLRLVERPAELRHRAPDVLEHVDPFGVRRVRHRVILARPTERATVGTERAERARAARSVTRSGDAPVGPCGRGPSRGSRRCGRASAGCAPRGSRG